MRKDTNVRRGYEPAYDPSTGQQYTPSLSKWNAAKGGYVNPNSPTEVLNCGTPETLNHARQDKKIKVVIGTPITIG